MKKSKIFIKNNIVVLLVLLVLSLSAISFYNYNIQKNLLLKQMQSDSKDIVNSIISAIKRFQEIKSTMNLQKLVSDMSLGLDIFEFRFLAPDGTIKNSMFKDEIGKVYNSLSFRRTMQGDQKIGEFFFETRDYVKVMAIYYPITMNNDLIGIIDLAVELPQYSFFEKRVSELILSHRKIDLLNLLKAIEGSIKNSMTIFQKTDIKTFLKNYVKHAKNILQISIIDQEGKVLVSSNEGIIGKKIDDNKLKNKKIVEFNGRPVYRMIIEDSVFNNEHKKLLLLIDAAPYKQNETRLLNTALSTSLIALFIALFIARAIYTAAIKQSQEEKERLEKLVKERTKEIELLSKTDSLTGLWNRRYLEEMLELEFKRAKRYKHPVSIMIVDLDHFKKINDTYGHLAGDEVLKESAKRILSTLRETDFVGRYGGEEIVVILPETKLDKAIKIAKKIKEAISSKPIIYKNKKINVTASIGISRICPKHKNFYEPFSEADEALYRAKKNGRNRIEIYSSNPPHTFSI